MDDRSPPAEVAVLAALADRLDALAETADLMGDCAQAQSLREMATTRRLEAMDLLRP